MLHVINNRQINITPEQLSTLDMLAEVPNGGFACVTHYKSNEDKKCIKSPDQDIRFISKFSYLKRNAILLANVQNISFEDVDLTHEKLAKLDDTKLLDMFNTTKAKMIDSYSKTDEGDNQSSKQREAAVKFYITHSPGVSVKLVSVDGEGGLKRLATENGVPVVESIHIAALEVSKKVHTEGEYKPTNHQTKTLVKQAIEKIAEKGVLKYKKIVLREGKFDQLRIGGLAIEDTDLESAQQKVMAYID